MAFKDILNKGMSMISKGAESAKQAVQEKKQASQEFDLLKTRSDHIGPMETYVVNNQDPQAGREQSILGSCFTINVENSKIINKLLPLEETVLDVKTGKEAKTEIQYAFALTDKHLWVLNQNEYKIYPFESIANCEIVNKGLMTQGVKFDNNAFYIDGSEGDVKKFIDTLMNKEYREDLIKRKTAYLCGMIPKAQLLNMANRGITFCDNKKVILHSGTENKVLDITDIQTVQLLVNDTVALSRGVTDSGNFVSSPMEARKMSLKFVLKMGEFTINILEQNMMNTTYKREDTTYTTNYDFGKKVVETTIDYMKGLVDFSAHQNVSQTTEVNQSQSANQPAPAVSTIQQQTSIQPTSTTATPINSTPAMSEMSTPTNNIAPDTPNIPTSTITMGTPNVTPPDIPTSAPAPVMPNPEEAINNTPIDPFGINNGQPPIDNQEHQN